MIKVLSVKFPWCIYIIYGTKDVENRTWKYPQKYRGRLYIHCGKKMDQLARIPFLIDRNKEQQLLKQNLWQRGFRDIAGKIIGYVDLDDIRRNNVDSSWYTGDLALMLSNPVALPDPIPVRGQLGFFNVDDTILGLKTGEQPNDT